MSFARKLLSRRALVAGAGAMTVGAGLLGLLRARLSGSSWPGTLDGADARRGHRLRTMDFPAPSEEAETDIVIAGGGIAGLAAGRTLATAGARFTLLELEDRAGGNARSGHSSISDYPLGAHYLPIPNVEDVGVRTLLEELGIITGWQNGKPVFDPYQIVADPDERLLSLGRWQDGLLPSIGLSPRDRQDIHRFFALMAGYRDRRDDAGRPAFAIPMELSARDADLLALDRSSFAAWLDRQDLTSPILRTHIRYCCRDDYGTEPEHLSAWAGIHYFAARRGDAANVRSDAVLTWPEGNGRLAGLMAQPLHPFIRPGQTVFAARRDGDHVSVDSFDSHKGRSTRWHCRAAILAVPRFVAARIAPAQLPAAADFSYAPWVVANVTVDRLPAGRGVPLAWDNVSVTSESLGYVVATHQSLASVPTASILTWYMPLSAMPPAQARRLMLERSLAEWQHIVAADLLATNPDLEGAIRRIDIWRWGHAMIRPTPGFLWGDARQAAAEPSPPFFFANSDLSGMSIFEEAYYRGTRAADQALAHMGGGHDSTITG